MSSHIKGSLSFSNMPFVLFVLICVFFLSSVLSPSLFYEQFVPVF